MTQVLLSSPMASFFSLEKAFREARALGVDGIELFPNRLTGDIENVLRAANKYDVPIKGIHFPFWWNNKSLPRVIASEGFNPVEWVYAVVWSAVIGSGNLGGQAANLSRHFRDAYCLLHPDVFSQMPENDRKFFRGRDVYFENERAKSGERNDLGYIVNDLISMARLSGINGQVMFDPKHLQIDMGRGVYPRRDISDLWRELKPRGLHFGFEGRFDLPGLPSDELWSGFREALREHPPEYIVLEVSSRDRKLYKAREMVGNDLGI